MLERGFTSAWEDGKGHKLINTLVETCVGVTFDMGDEAKICRLGDLDGIVNVLLTSKLATPSGSGGFDGGRGGGLAIGAVAEGSEDFAEHFRIKGMGEEGR